MALQLQGQNIPLHLPSPLPGDRCSGLSHLTARFWKHYVPQNPYLWNKGMCCEDLGSRSVVLKLEYFLESYKDLLKHRSLSTLSVFDSEVLTGWGLRVCITVKFPGETDAAIPLTKLWDLLFQHPYDPVNSFKVRYFLSKAGHCLVALGLCLKLLKISMHFSVQWLLLVFPEEDYCTHRQCFLAFQMWRGH